MEMEPLPWPVDALYPTISPQSIRAHRVIEQRYVDSVEVLARGAHKMALDRSGYLGVVASADKQRDPVLLRAAAQAWSHQFFWKSLRPYGTVSQPSAAFHGIIRQTFGTFDVAISSAMRLSRQLFGSGWLWLTRKNRGVSWSVTHNEGIPRLRPLMAIDLWEHAYYLDYTPSRTFGPSARERWVEHVLYNLGNWEFASNNFFADS